MKNIFLLLLFSLNISCSQKQNNYEGFDVVKHDSSITVLKGKWRINELIINTKTKEYFLHPQNPDGYNYGNNIFLNADQTFVCSYSAPCGNDCFTTTKGKYKIIDKNYICFYLENINRSGDCSGNSQPNEDLGLYYYYKKDNVFQLIKSNKNLEQDKNNIHNRNLITAKRQEIEKFYKKNGLNDLLFSWKRTDFTDEKDIIASCMAENQIKNYEILYYDKGDKYSTQAIALVKVNGEFRYIIYDTWGKPKVCLYDDSKVLQIDKLVNTINNDKLLEKKSFKEKNMPNEPSSIKKTITALKRGSKIHKVIYKIYPENIDQSPINTTTFYFQNSIPVYIEYQYDFVGKENNRSEKKGMYVLDWKNEKVVVKDISRGGIYPYIYGIKPVTNRILDEINR